MVETAISFNVFYELACKNVFSSYVGLCYMTLVFFRLLRKNLGNLQKCLDRRPWQKIARTPVAPRATQWCIRQFWAKCVDLKKESVTDYLHGLRIRCTGLNLPRFQSNRCRS